MFTTSSKGKPILVVDGHEFFKKNAKENQQQLGTVINTKNQIAELQQHLLLNTFWKCEGVLETTEKQFKKKERRGDNNVL